jgi:Zn-dependent peptidase ImmA (M78 family)
MSLYELGGQTPSSSVVGNLSRVLQMPATYFTTPVLEWPTLPLWFRSLRSTTRLARAAARARFHWLVEIVATVEQQVALPRTDVPRISVDDPYQLLDTDIEHLAETCRTDWGLASEPIRNVVRLAEERGVVVTTFDLLAPGMDAFSSWMSNRAYIVLDRDRPAARQRLDVAHELGHLVLHRNLDEVDDDGLQVLEKQAFRFGSALLLPRGALLREVAPAVTLTSLLTAKKRWGVSLKMLVHRAEELNIITKARAQQLYKQYSTNGYGRAGEPGDEYVRAEVPRLLPTAVAACLDVWESLSPLPVSDVMALSGLGGHTAALGSAVLPTQINLF